MNNKHATLEMIAPTVDEAIQKGLDELGLSREKIEVEVLDEGSAGLLGLGARQARIRISVQPEKPEEEKVEKVEKEKNHSEPEPEADNVLTLAKETVTDLLEKMKVPAQVTVYYGEDSEDPNYHPVKIDITGNDLSILIGPRAATLDALQYITRLIVGRELEHGFPLSIDVEGYRERREQQVRQLAQRVAKQVISTKRRQALEPMPPNERRFAHIELQDNPQVYTESTGTTPHRKVIVYPK
ncbi:MAG: protein jag [Chloroflexota bacterium]|nr:MAG: protein jag [Chloroflexota bacterium]